MMKSVCRINYTAPRSVEEALSLLEKHQETARVKAGGTDLVPNMKNRLFPVEHIVDISFIQGLDYITCSNGQVSLGALTTLSRIERSKLLAQKLPLLSEAAGKVASPQIRNAGTIGGNVCLDTRCWYYNQSESWQKARAVCMKLEGHICYIAKASKACHALFSSDTGTALTALGAKVLIQTPGGEKQIPIAEFYTGDGLKVNVVEPDEIVTEVSVPSQGPREYGSYAKYRVRDSIDFPLLSVAVLIRLHPSEQSIEKARIVLGAALSGPFSPRQAEEFLAGKRLTEETISEAAALAYRNTKVVSSSGISGAYRKEMTRALVKHALREVARKAPIQPAHLGRPTFDPSRDALE